MSHVATAFGVIKVRRRGWGPQVNGRYAVNNISLLRVTQKRTTVNVDESLVEIELIFPDGYFDVNLPKAVVTFPMPPEQEIWANGEVAEPLTPPEATQDGEGWG